MPSQWGQDEDGDDDDGEGQDAGGGDSGDDDDMAQLQAKVRFGSPAL